MGGRSECTKPVTMSDCMQVLNVWMFMLSKYLVRQENKEEVTHASRPPRRPHSHTRKQ